MPDSVRVRFAPSPTGALHVGGARTAIYNWAFARRNGGVFILRIDDTDPERSTARTPRRSCAPWSGSASTGTKDPRSAVRSAPTSRPSGPQNYAAALEHMKANGSAYPCFCSTEELEAKRAAARAGEGARGYDRTCRRLDPAAVAARLAAGEPHVWRLAVPEDRGDIVVDDAVRGETVFPASAMDDFVLARGDGTPTYNFATVVDDADMQITHVIRGDDHLSNTPRQILVYEALGHPVPMFAHLSMIWGADGKKLSKRHGATSVEAFRDEGFLPEALLNYLALLGWSLDGETTIMLGRGPEDALLARSDLEEPGHLRLREARMDERRLHPGDGAGGVRGADVPLARRGGARLRGRPRGPARLVSGARSARLGARQAHDRHRADGALPVRRRRRHRSGGRREAPGQGGGGTRARRPSTTRSLRSRSGPPRRSRRRCGRSPRRWA